MNLVFMQSGRPVLRQRLDGKSRVVIGRSADCDIQLIGSEISRYHCEIKKKDKVWVVRNLSKSGTLINNSLVEDDVPLTPGDKIKIGLWSVEAVKPRSNSTTIQSISLIPTKKIKNDADEDIPAPSIQLVVPPDPPHNFSLRSEITIGQHPDCRLKIADPHVSHWHCNISWNGSSAAISDVGSSNGTFIEGHKVSKALLDNEGEFIVGKTPVKYKIEKQEGETTETFNKRILDEAKKVLKF